MKSRGMFRRMALMIGLASALESNQIKHYPDPSIRMPTGNFRTGRFKGPVRVRKPLPCTPGTITYRDWLVRELGYDRRLADGYLYAYLNGYKIKMPMPGDLVALL